MTASDSDDHEGKPPQETAAPSFDPRTWLAPGIKEAPPPSPPQAAAPHSFDPSTWRKPSPTGAEPPAPAPPPEPKARDPGRRNLILAAGAGVLGLGAVAAGLALLKRPTAPAPAPRIAQPPGGDERQVLSLASLDGLAKALVDQGLSTQTSQAAATAAIGAFTGPRDDLKLDLVLSRSPDGAPALTSLQIRRADGSGVIIKPAASGFVATAVAASTHGKVLVVHGQMDSTGFYTSAVAAGLNDALIPAFFQAFVYDFDFQREIEPGDVFEAAVEQTVNDQGQALGAGQLIYAAMNTKAKSRALYSFTPSGAAASAWFDGAGRNIRRSLMRTPVEGARISSTFGMRLHPVLGFTRMHKGTDFAAPIGTPVYASGDGKITFMGVHGDHGNYIAIQHSPSLSTAYAHLSKFGDGMAVGVSVRQGQEIALTGNSGLTSGPHLHYEVLVNGVQVDSQTFQTEQGQALAGDPLKAFIRERDRIDGLRAASL